MIWFMIRFEGRGIEEKRSNLTWWQKLISTERQTITGFYTTRFVEAEDAEVAKEIARCLVLVELSQHKEFDLSRLQLSVDEIRTVLESRANQRAKGFSFYGRDE
jgi:hypothetical protein